MGQIKKIAFQENINETAEIFRALGHPARLQILKILLLNKSCTCGTIVEQIPLAQSTISKHLLELKKANLITFHNEGKKTIYSLLNENLSFSKDFLTNHIIVDKNIALQNTLEKSYANLKVKRRNRKSNPKLKSLNYVFLHKSKTLL